MLMIYLKIILNINTIFNENECFNENDNLVNFYVKKYEIEELPLILSINTNINDYDELVKYNNKINTISYSIFLCPPRKNSKKSSNCAPLRKKILNFQKNLLIVPPLHEKNRFHCRGQKKIEYGI